MKKFLGYATLLLVAAVPVTAQMANDQAGMTKQQADEMLKELRQIRLLLERQQAKPAAPQEEQPTRAKITDLSGVSMLGTKTAPLTIVEYTDYQCPFCQRFHVTAFSELKKQYIDTGKVRFFSKDMPLDFHPNALRAAQAARCAAEQKKFWELRDVMGANPDKLDIDHIMNFAADLKMDTAALRACVDSGKYKDTVQRDVLEAMKIGANGTPTFIVGKSVGEGVDGELVVGAMPFEMFDAKLKSLEK
uniref:DSBA oxidoreductase n=1 Tax=Solibacter usitatus (strain Ellin6076) TaxID=234267 RepID=Q02BN4_SOLUE